MRRRSRCGSGFGVPWKRGREPERNRAEDVARAGRDLGLAARCLHGARRRRQWIWTVSHFQAGSHGFDGQHELLGAATHAFHLIAGLVSPTANISKTHLAIGCVVFFMACMIIILVALAVTIATHRYFYYNVAPAGSAGGPAGGGGPDGGGPGPSEPDIITDIPCPVQAVEDHCVAGSSHVGTEIPRSSAASRAWWTAQS
ncbi:hypothetical protein HPB51_003106 [Rhipicephalus microplus]|uniref:Uncharacterized protein n=1 Tax=Rhipicephalus microplus TaxID=6941 RepID=A0A9J6EJZ0_RHIMP|nr:hypothetical protein HPB51_003106 [Rhipicephalus microplus]